MSALFAIASVALTPSFWPSFAPTQVVWKLKHATAAKEEMKPFCGRFPSWLESNCIYAMARVNNYPIAIFPFDKVTLEGEPIARNLYVNKKAVRQLGVEKKMWQEFKKTYGALPRIPKRFQ